MARITHPRPTLGRTRPGVGGVVFQDGVAVVDLTDKPILHDYFVRHGYSIDYDIDELADDVKVNIPISALTIDELLRVAEQNELEVPAQVRRAKKAVVVDFIESALAARKLHDEGAPPVGTTTEAPVIAPGDVLELNEQGHELLGGDDSTRATVLAVTEDGLSALVEWNGGIDHPTTITLNLTRLAED